MSGVTIAYHCGPTKICLGFTITNHFIVNPLKFPWVLLLIVIVHQPEIV